MTTLDLLRQHEGLRLKPYRCPAGKLTIGYGRNLDDNGITKQEAEYMLLRDWQRVRSAIEDEPWFGGLNPARQAVLESMAFQMGVAGLLTFKRMLASVEAGEYGEASIRMLRSLWARQTPTRAQELAEMMRTGEWPNDSNGDTDLA